MFKLGSSLDSKYDSKLRSNSNQNSLHSKLLLVNLKRGYECQEQFCAKRTVLPFFRIRVLRFSAALIVNIHCVHKCVFSAHIYTRCDHTNDRHTKQTERECTPTQFKCLTGNKCIEGVYRCDGHPDCPDHSDEDCANETITHVTQPTSTPFYPFYFTFQFSFVNLFSIHNLLARETSQPMLKANREHKIKQ